MGKLTDQYKQLIQQETETVIPEQPDKVKKPQEWLDWKIADSKKKAISQKISHCLTAPNLKNEEWDTVFKDAFGEANAKEIRDKAWNSMIFTQTLRNKYVYGKEDTLLKEFSKEDREAFGLKDAVTERILKKLVADNKIPKEYLDNAYNIYFKSYIVNGVNKKTIDRAGLMESYEKNLQEDQIQLIREEMDSPLDVLSQPDEKNILYPYREKCEALAKDLPDNDEYKHVLDFAAKHIMRPTEDYYKALVEREGLNNSLENSVQDEIFNANKDTFKGGKYNSLFDTKKIGHDSVNHVKPEKNADFESFKKEENHLSNDTLEGMRLILEKMEKMELHKYSPDYTGEDGNKIYGFAKLVNKQEALQKALDAEKKDPAAILKAGKEFEEAWKDQEELFQLANKYFSQNDYLVPGNLDSIRTKYIPVSFTKDFRTTAQVNTLFQVHMMLKANKMPIDEYLKNPTAAVLENGLTYFNEKGLAARTKEMDYEKSLDFLFRTGQFKTAGSEYTKHIPTANVQRSLAYPVLLEKNENNRNNAIVYGHYLHEHIQSMGEREKSKFFILDIAPQNEEERKNMNQTLQNLIVVEDEDRNLNAMIGNFPETDIHGQVIHPALDLDEYIAGKKMNYFRINYRAETLMEKRNEANSNSVSADMVTEATLNAFAKVLSANQKDRGLQEFNNMETFLLDGLSKLSDAAPEPLKNRVSTLIGDYKAMNLPLLKAEEHVNAAKEADRNVYNGSKAYDEAAESLTTIRNSIKELLNIKNDLTDAEKHRKIAEIRQKLDESDAKIQAYIDYKLSNGVAEENLSAKPKRRVKVMKEAKAGNASFRKYLTKLESDLNANRARNQQKHEALQAKGIDRPTDLDIYEDPYNFSGKPRLEQLDQMYRELKAVDPATMYSHEEFRNFRRAFEKMKDYAEKHTGVFDREEMDEYRLLAEDVKLKAQIYRDKKNSDAQLYQERNNRPFEFKDSTTLRMNLTQKMIDMVDKHLTYSSGEFVKEFGGTQEERALGKWAQLVRAEDSSRGDLIGKNYEKYMNSICRSMYLEKIKVKFETDENFSAQDFLNAMKEENIAAGAQEMNALIHALGLEEHFTAVTNRKNTHDYEDEIEENVVNVKRYQFLTKADETLDGVATEEDLHDLRGVDHKYIRGEVKNLCAKILLASNGKYMGEYGHYLKDFGYASYMDHNGKLRMKEEIDYKVIGQQPQVDFYEHQLTGIDYSKLSDRELSEKIEAMQTKYRDYHEPSVQTAETASKEELEEVTEYVMTNLRNCPVRRAEIVLGLDRESENIKDAIDNEFRRRSSMYSIMRGEIQEELTKAKAVVTKREEVRKFFESRRKVAETLKPGEIISVTTEDKKEIELEVLGVEDGMIYFDDFGEKAPEGEKKYYTDPVEGEKAYNRGAVSVEDFTKNLNFRKENHNAPDRRNVYFNDQRDRIKTEWILAVQDTNHTRLKLGEVKNKKALEYLKEEDVFKAKAYDEEMKKMPEYEKDYLDRYNNESDIDHITNPDKKKQEIEENQKAATERAKIEVDRQVRDKVDEHREEFYNKAADESFKERFQAKVDEMADFKTRKEKAKALYNHIDLQLDKKDDKNKQNEKKENEKKENEKKGNEKHQEEKNNNRIVIEENDNPNKINLDPAYEKRSNIVEKEVDLVSDCIEKRYQLKQASKNSEDAKAKNAPEIAKYDAVILNHAYKVLYRRILEKQLEENLIDEKKYNEKFDAFDKPEVKSDFMKIFDGNADFKNKFEERMKHHNRTEGLNDLISKKCDGILADLQAHARTPEAEKKVNNLITVLAGNQRYIKNEAKNIKEAEQKKAGLGVPKK